MKIIVKKVVIYGDPEVMERLAVIDGLLVRVLEMLEMARTQSQEQSDKFDELIGAVNTESNRIAAVLEAFQQQIKAGMTETEVKKAQQGLQDTIDRLKQIGTDQAQPVPPVPEGGA